MRLIRRNKEYLKRLMIIAVPIMLSSVISQLQMIIDRIFLGHRDDLYMSALGNATTPMWTTMSFCFSIAMGASILISQSVGAGDSEHIEEYSASMVKWNNVVPVLLFFFWIFAGEYVFRIMGVDEEILPLCMTYAKWYAPVFLVVGIESSFSVILQTSNYTKPLVFYGIIRSGTNIILDYLFIFGKFGFPEWGLKGAAIATTIAEYLGVVFSIVVVLTSDKVITKPSVAAVIGAKFKPFFKSIKLGINVALEDFAWNFGNLIIIRILNSIDKKAAGIYTIVFSVEILVVVIIGSIGNGTTTLTGEARGANDLKMYKGVVKVAYAISVMVSVIMLIVCLLNPESILSLFTSDQTIISGCGLYLLLVCLNLYGKSGNIIVGCGIRGSGNTVWMFATQIFGTFLVIGAACLFVYGFKLGIAGVFLAVIVDEGTRALINLGKFISITKKWQTS